MSSSNPNPSGVESVSSIDSTPLDVVEGVAPSFSSPAEAEAFQRALVAQLQATPVVAVAADAVQPVDDVKLHYDEETKRLKHVIRCRFCDCKVLTPDSCTYETQQVRSQNEKEKAIINTTNALPS